MMFLEKLYFIEKMTLNENILVADLKIAEQHPVFDAHFPGSPILPGFLLLNIATAIFSTYCKPIHIKKIIKAKFNSPVLNGHIVQCIIKIDDSTNGLVITYKNQDSIVSTTKAVFF